MTATLIRTNTAGLENRETFASRRAGKVSQLFSFTSVDFYIDFSFK